MTATLRHSASSSLRIVLMAVLFLGPLVALGVSQSDETTVAKRGAGLVLFVSLQRQSMS
ncbi:MAG: hypothetical protein ACOH2J_02405 [Allorhizobium sp.]